ncbi:unnamed protein product [Arabidopsis thaliana]|uniref:GTD-binding domain-containing protein n=1 Tax=Arabidopsis thaliana TaxID=3702 RepID=A0A5S9V124_ARATH|nr:unnamed protein product [Arabidopsis thaliana]
MEITSFLKLLSQTDGFGFGIFYLEKINRISPNIEFFNSFNREHKDCNNNNNNNNGFISKSHLADGLDQKKPIILHWSSDSTNRLSWENCDLLLLRDGLDHIQNRENTVALSETELDEKNHHGEEEESEDEEESQSQNDEDQLLDVITLRTMVKRERKRGDYMKKELEKERRAAESAAEEAMAMLLKLRMEKSVVEMETKQYKRVAEQKQVYDQEVIQSLQWMLMKLDDDEDKIQM